MNELQIVNDEDQLPSEAKTEVIHGYSAVTSKVAELIQTAEEILTKDTTSDDVAKEARECRISLMRARTETERIRKELIRPIELHKKAISGAAAIITDAVSRKERAMSDIEDAYEQRKEDQRRALHKDRLDAVLEVIGDEQFSELSVIDFASKSKAEYAELVSYYTDAVAARKAEREEKARLEEQARLEDEARREQQRLEDEARRAELAKKAAEEEEKRKAMEAENAALRQQLEEARKAKDAAESQIRAEEEAKKKAAAEALAVQRQLQEQKIREAQEKAAAERKAKLAPDREKLIKFSDDVEKFVMEYQTELTTKEGQQLLKSARSNLKGYATAVRQMADKLA